MALAGSPKLPRTTWISAYTARGPEKDTEVNTESCLWHRPDDRLPRG